MKKYLLLVLALLLCTSFAACDINAAISFGESEVPTQDSDTPTEALPEDQGESPSEKHTDAPIDIPSEESQKPSVTIDGITFDNALKAKINAAKNYEEICKILKKEATFIENSTVVYSFMIKSDSESYPILVRFKNLEDKAVVCEDAKVTTNEAGLDTDVISQDILKQITLGKTFEELLEICGRSAGFCFGDTLKYEWSFGEEIKIRANLVNFIHVERNKLSVLYIDYWDSNVTNTTSEINRTKLEVGQTIAELNELFGQEGRFDSAIRKYWWDFDDGKSLEINYYEDKTDPTLPLENQAKFTGLSEIVITE